MDAKRHDRRPMYHQIADDLRTQYGGQPPGTELPSIEQLRDLYTTVFTTRVSAATIRAALDMLDRDDVIAVRHGKRSIVLEPDTDEEADYEAIRHEVTDLNHRVDGLADQVAALVAEVRALRPAPGPHPD